LKCTPRLSIWKWGCIEAGGDGSGILLGSSTHSHSFWHLCCSC